MATFVKEIAFTAASGSPTLDTGTGHAVGDVAIIVCVGRAIDSDALPSITGGTHTGANLTEVGNLTVTGSNGGRVKGTVYTYEFDSTSAATFTLDATAHFNAGAGVIYSGIDVPTAFSDSTNGAGNQWGTSISIDVGTVTSGNTVIGFYCSGADTTTDEVSSFTGSSLSSINLRSAGNTDLGNGIGIYIADGTADSTTVGPFTATANSGDWWVAASIELVDSAGGGTTEEGDGTSDGTSTVTGAGESTVEADATADGSSTVTGQGSSIAESDGTSDGSSSATGAGEIAGTVQSGDGSSDGSATASGEGEATVSGDGTSDGTSSADAEGGAVAEADGSSAGSGSGSGQGQATSGGVGSSDGTSTATGQGQSAGSNDGQSSGSSTATGQGEATAEGDGSSAGTSSGAGEGESTAEGAGSSAGSSSASAVGQDATENIGQSSGSSTATGEGQAVTEGGGSSDGTSGAIAEGESTAEGVGSSSSSSGASGQNTTDGVPVAEVPSERTLTVVAENRTFAIPLEDRTLKVA
ncbi:hypothetical protein [uncultured Ruegeria sp.]|uniref:hypothetical protein n=1 Tax=uncultured Ruegeria sp. TaxID=259304 RepID=UPI0026066669|nr:hypothetical protein [uncultured Ruegeria sp.]